MLEELLVSRRLKNGLWLKIHIFLILKDIFMNNAELQEEFGVDIPFLGRRRDIPPQSFRVGQDVFVGYFIVVYPNDNDNQPFWIAQALTNVNAELVEHPTCILI
jgi:hypothetical protein